MHTNVEKWAKVDIVLWRSYEVITVNYFCVRHKNSRKHNQHFKQLFFKTNLHLSDYISTYGKLNLLSINRIFLVFPSREMQRKLMQTKVYYKLSLSSLKRSILQTFNSSSCKKVFPSVLIIDTTCFDECFSFRLITANSIFYTILSLPRGLVQPPCCCVLSNKCFERSPHFISTISTIILRWC